jgi:hypothetical protein
MRSYHSGGLQSILPQSGMVQLKTTTLPIKIVPRKKQINSDDNEIVHHPDALVVGSVMTMGPKDNPLDSVPDKFKKWTYKCPRR